MKTFIILAAAALLAVSCGGKRQSAAAEATQTRATESTARVYKLDELLTEAETLTGTKVTVRGHVTHTCKHSGKRCFIVGDDQSTSFRVEAKGNIGGFNRELVGSELAITGVLKERRLNQEYLDQMEKDINERKSSEDGSAETCEAELANVAGMKAWMEKNGKDYYALYYMDGEEYEVVE